VATSPGLPVMVMRCAFRKREKPTLVEGLLERLALADPSTGKVAECSRGNRCWCGTDCGA
jgi:hypothetical protein